MKIAILGGSGGIGSALAARLASDGAELFLGGRDAMKLANLGRELNAHTQILNATQTGAVDEFFQAATAQMGGLDGAVNCIGSILLKPAHQTTDAEWSQVLALNLTTAFETVRAGARAMSSNENGGSVVLISTVAARIGLANHEAIAAAKAGVQGLTLSAAATYARQNVRFNCVAPGLIDTPLAKNITENATFLKASTALHPLNRIGTAEQVASLIHWLLQRENDWITGQIIGVDGGLGSVRSR